MTGHSIVDARSKGKTVRSIHRSAGARNRPENLVFLQERGFNYIADACIMVQTRLAARYRYRVVFCASTFDFLLKSDILPAFPVDSKIATQIRIDVFCLIGVAFCITRMKRP